jgi:hypothetical protein
MKIHNLILGIAGAMLLATAVFAQDAGGGGFVITLKNGSAIKGRTLAREEGGKLRLTMTETALAEPKSYALIDMDDADSIKASTTDSDSIRIKVRGGSELKCKEFALGPDKVTVKIGSRSSIDVPWEQIESISFAQ